MRQYRDEIQKIVYEVFGDELYEKDSIIEDQKNELHDCYLALKSKDEKIESLNSEIVLKDKMIESLDSEIVLKDKMFEFLCCEIIFKDIKISNLFDKFKELRKLHSLNLSSKNH